MRVYNVYRTATVVQIHSFGGEPLSVKHQEVERGITNISLNNASTFECDGR